MLLLYTFIVQATLVLLLHRLILNGLGRGLGWYLRRKSKARRAMILRSVEAEQKAYERRESRSKSSDEDWEKVDAYATTIVENGGKGSPDWRGFIGFFHPFCDAGGGGERVLWAAIRATQKRYPQAVCVVYTGDHDATKLEILARVKDRFNIRLHRPTVVFLYLSTRHYVLASTWPRFTLLGQSLGSVILAVDAFSLLVPDIFIDTMGYAFALAFGKFCYPQMPTAAYVHYPTISTDMLGALDLEPGKGLHAGAGKGLRGVAKKKYWRLFALIYSWVGGHVDVVMANSSWTRAHMQALWGPYRTKRQKQSEIEILFPPVAVEELEEAIDVSEASEQKREKILLYIAQFRPEKNHGLILRAFADLIHSNRPDAGARKGLKLKLIGSVRDSKDATRVYELRLLAHELKIKEDVEFIRDASWPEILKWLGKSSIGVNGMWNEHFGIGVVEYQAAGLISVVNNSGGPKDDIVVEMGGGPTGYHASTESEYSAAFLQAISLSPQETLAMRKRARLSARRFTEEAFANHWILQVDKLVALQTKAQVAPK